MALAWHIALTERAASTKAEAQLRLQQFEVFNPKIRNMVLIRNNLRCFVRQYIPGYIFVRFDLDLEGWQPINWTRGVKTLMYVSHEHPALIKDEVMQPLFDACDADGFIKEREADESLIRVGSRVKVLSGYGAGNVRPVVWTSGDRLRLFMDILGSQRQVELRRRDVELLPAI